MSKKGNTNVDVEIGVVDVQPKESLFDVHMLLRWNIPESVTLPWPQERSFVWDAHGYAIATDVAIRNPELGVGQDTLDESSGRVDVRLTSGQLRSRVRLRGSRVGVGGVGREAELVEINNPLGE